MSTDAFCHIQAQYGNTALVKDGVHSSNRAFSHLLFPLSAVHGGAATTFVLNGAPSHPENLNNSIIIREKNENMSVNTLNQLISGYTCRR